jgi:hypothetical protein
MSYYIGDYNMSVGEFYRWNFWQTAGNIEKEGLLQVSSVRFIFALSRRRGRF